MHLYTRWKTLLKIKENWNMLIKDPVQAPGRVWRIVSQTDRSSAPAPDILLYHPCPHPEYSTLPPQRICSSIAEPPLIHHCLALP